jgi:prevent-host-death family protein
MTVSTAVTRNRLSTLLSEVTRVGEVTITKRGVPVVKLVAVGPSFDREKARRIAAGLLEAKRGARAWEATAALAAGFKLAVCDAT